MRPVSIRWFSVLYLASALLVAVDALLQWDRLLADFTRNNSAPGVNPVLLLVASVGFVVGVFLVLWFLATRLRIGYVRWIMLGTAAWQAVGLVRSGAIGDMPVLALATLALQAIALMLAFTPSAARWFAEAETTPGGPR